eukprot:48669_1
MSCIDNTLNNIGIIITKARESSNRYRSIMNSRTNANTLKFTTTNDINKSVSKTGLQQTENEETLYGNGKLLLQKENKLKTETISDVECWMDVIFNEIIAQ